MTDCEKLEACAFHKKYESVAASTIKRIIADYCVGTESKQCARKSYIEKTGQDPPDSMMPTGLDAESGKVIEF